MSVEFTKENLLKLIKDTKENAKINHKLKPKEDWNAVIDYNGKSIPNRQWTGKWDSFKLEPQLMSEYFDIPFSQLEEMISKTEDIDLIQRWEDYKDFQALIMTYDPQHSQVKSNIFEHRLHKFNKNEIKINKVIVQEVNISDKEMEDLLAEEIKENHQNQKDKLLFGNDYEEAIKLRESGMSDIDIHKKLEEREINDI